MKTLILIFLFPIFALFLGIALRHDIQRFFISCCMNLMFWHFIILIFFSVSDLKWVLVYAILGFYGCLFDFITLQLDN